jgi:hypothetical protein
MLPRFFQSDPTGLRWAAAEESAGMEMDSWIHPEDVEGFVQKWRESLSMERASREPLECGGLMATIAGSYTINLRFVPKMEEF